MKPARDQDYRHWIATKPCVACGRYGVHCHHLDPNMARRGSDYRAVPLCMNHHQIGRDAIHRIGRRNFEAVFHLDLGELAAAFHGEWLGQLQRAA